MLAAFTSLQNAQKVKEFLAKKKLLHEQYLPLKDLDHIYFPLTAKTKVPDAKVVNTKFSFEKKAQTITVEDLLKGKLTKKELSLIPRSQEIVGSIMILEIPEELQKKEKIIAEAYLRLQKQAQTIVKKTQIHTGIYRTRKVKILAGKKTKETIHHENGINLKLHLEKTYFTSRLANERLRIAKLVQPEEEILVMFSGVAPYPLVIAKNSPAKIIYGIEINPFAHQYALQNIALNKMENKIIVYEGDVLKIAPSLKHKFDRIIMPLPKTGEEFLPLALPKLNAQGSIHFYAFLEEKNIPTEKKKITAKCYALGYKVKDIKPIPCGQFSPGTFRICFDIKFSN